MKYQSVQDFIFHLEGEQKAIVAHLHQRLSDHHDLMGNISYNIPMYYRKSWVCYLNPIKKNGIELAFTKGNQLSNEQGILNSKNRKMVAGIELYNIQDLPERAIDEIVQEALILDQLQP